MSDQFFRDVAYLLLSGLGLVSVAYLGLELRERWVARVQPRSQPTGDQEPPATTLTAPIAESDREASIKSRSVASSDRRRLQQLLTEGVELDENLPALPSFGLALQPAPRPIDVDAWEARVEAELQERPRDLALFRYEPQRSPLAALGSLSMIENPLKKRLQQRLRQLETIVKRTP